MSAELDVDGVIDDRSRHILLLCGTGGVGKTSLSAALAVRAADRGRRVTVMTIDPARRLATALGIDQLTDEPARVAGIDESAGGSLDALMLDMKRTFDEAVSAALPAPTAAQLFRNPFYQTLSTSFSGTQEYMAMERLAQLYRQARVENRWDLIVVDTPPSRSALDFLDGPQKLAALLDGRLMRLLTAPARGGLRILGAGMNVAAQIVGRLIGTESFADLSAFAGVFEQVMGGFRQRAERTRATLASDRAGFVVVATPDRAALTEARFFADRLASERLPLLGTIVNQRVRTTTDLSADDARDLAATVPPESAEWAALMEQARLYERMTTQEALIRRHLAPGEPVREVEMMDSELSDVEELRQLGRILAAENRRPRGDV